MKIKTKLIIFYILSVVLIFTTFLLISIFLKNNYIDIKYARAKNYYDVNDVSIDEYTDYLINKGFIVTNKSIEPYEGTGNLVCHLKEDEIIVYEDSKPILFAVINEKIINDTLLIIDILLIIIFLFILIILLILYSSIKKYFINRIKILEDNVSNFEIGEDFSIESKSYNDEITKLENEITDMIFNLNLNEEQKVKFAFALSHDLKNPIMKIKAILSMYKKDIPDYNDKEQMIKMVNLELEDLVDKINYLIELYKEKNIAENNITINFKEELKFKIKSEIPDILIKDTSKDFIIDVEEKKASIILNNIVSNIAKYSKKKEVIISYKEDYLEIRNEIIKDKSYKDGGVGNIINDIFAKDIGLEITNEVDGNYYIIKIKDIS